VYLTSVDYLKAPGIHQLLEIQADRRPDAIAIAAPERTPLSFHRLLLHAKEVVQTLNALGIGRNDRVAVVAPNGPEMASAFLTISSGATFGPLNPAYRANEFDFLLSDLQAKALIVHSGTDSPAIAVAQNHRIPIIELSPGAAGDAGTFSLRGQRQPAASPGGFAQAEDVALILYTSGTTSRPKMVPLTHSNLLASAGNISATLELTEVDRCLNVMPLFHIHGLVGAVLSSAMAGCSVICTSGFDPEKFFAWLEQFRPTWYTAVPTMHQAVLSCALANSEMLRRCPLRFIRSSSAPLPLRLMQELEEVFRIPVIEAYGMTEASHQIASNRLPPRARKPGSVGLAAGAEVAVMDEEGNLVTSGEVGEIVIGGPNVMSGYGSTREVEVNEESFAQGWFRTGDVGYLDEDGYLFLTGRLKEIINRGGEKISPEEVDEVLKEHPAVSEAVTFSVPHATLGQDVAAAIVLRENNLVTGAEIQRFAATRLAEFKVPRQMLIVNGIPRGSTGKIQRIGLAERIGLAATCEEASNIRKDFAPPDQSRPEQQRPFVAPRTPVEKSLAQIWAEVLKLEKVGTHDNFFDLGGHSLSAIQVISQVREAFHIEFPLRALFEKPTIDELAKVIIELEAQKIGAEELGHILADIESLSDEEAQERVARGNIGSTQSPEAADNSLRPKNLLERPDRGRSIMEREQ